MSQFAPTTAAPIIQKDAFIGIMWTFTGIATIGLAFRLYIRYISFRKLLIDDYIASFAWLLLLAMTCIWQMTMDGMYHVARAAAGLEMPTADFPQISERFLRGSNVALVMFYVGLWSIKFSFLVFFKRLGAHIPSYRIFWWIVTFITAASLISCLGTIQYHCLSDPFTKIYMNCSSNAAIEWQKVTIRVNCALDLITDALIMSMPISLLWSVRVSLGRKFLLAGLFSLVLVTMVIAIIRVTVVGKGYVGGNKQAEITWLYFWTFIEFAAANLIASLASFRQLFTHNENQSRQEQMRKQELAQKEESGSRPRVLKARAKYLQQSLFDTLKTTDDTKRSSSEDGSIPLSGLGSTGTYGGTVDDSHSVVNKESVYPKSQV